MQDKAGQDVLDGLDGRDFFLEDLEELGGQLDRGKVSEGGVDVAAAVGAGGGDFGADVRIGPDADAGRVGDCVDLFEGCEDLRPA